MALKLQSRSGWMIASIAAILVAGAGCAGDASKDDGQIASTSSALGNLTDMGSAPAISSRGTGTLDIFALDTSGRMMKRSYSNPAGYTDWCPLPVAPAGHYFLGQVAAVSWSSTRNDLFVSGEDVTIWHAFANSSGACTGWSGWEPIGTITNGYGMLRVSSSGVNNLDVFAPYQSGAGRVGIKQIKYLAGWQAQQPVIGDQFAGFLDFAVTSWGPGRIDFVINSNGVTHYSSDDAGLHWSGPDPLDFPCPASNVALNTWGVNVLDVIGTSGSQVCQMSYRPGTLWATEHTYDLAVAPPTDPNEGVLPAFLPASVSWAADRIDVVVGLSQSSGSIASPWHMWFNTASPPGWFGGEPY